MRTQAFHTLSEKIEAGVNQLRVPLNHTLQTPFPLNEDIKHSLSRSSLCIQTSSLERVPLVTL